MDIKNKELIAKLKGSKELKSFTGSPFTAPQVAQNIDVSKSMLPGPPPGSVNVLSGYTVNTPQDGGGFNYHLERYMGGNLEQQVLNFSLNVFDNYYVLDDQLNANGYQHFVSGIHKNGPYPSPNLPYVPTNPNSYALYIIGSEYRLVVNFAGYPGCDSSLVLVAMPQTI
jgi:hypothetical protein